MIDKQKMKIARAILVDIKKAARKRGWVAVDEKTMLVEVYYLYVNNYSDDEIHGLILNNKKNWIDQ